MTTLDQAEALVYKKEYAAAKAICLKLKQHGDTSMRLEFLLGSIALNMRDFLAALDIFRDLSKRYPNHAGVLNNLGAAMQYTGGNLDVAQALIERSLVIEPTNIPALVNLGELLLSRNRHDKARLAYARIAEISPSHPQGPYGQAMCDLSMNDFKAAFDRLEAAVKLAPHHPSILANLLHAATQTQHHDRAIEIARLIASREELCGQLPMAWAILKRYCIWDEASVLLPRVLDLLLAKEALPEQFTPIALEILSSPDIDHATLKRLHTQCGNGLRLRNQGFPVPNLEKAFALAGRMRIGYLSGDFRNHVAALFIRGVINHHDPGMFEIFLYSSAPVGSQDEMTGKFFRTAEHFVHCHDMDDGELAHRIAKDGIHVLIDLSGYTSHTRTPVLSLKPAPVQASYIGYPATYGLAEVDYFLSSADLTGSDYSSAFVEAPLELPGLYAVSPSPAAVTREASLPCLTRGFPTFGSLINPYKINPETIALWARVMREVPNSHLYLNHPVYACKATRQSVINRFIGEGIAPERLTITEERPPQGSLHYIFYDEIDIVLDATPMTGGAGTTDALMVGVPVISRIGTVFHERLSAAAIRANVPDPDDFLAETDDDYVAKAVSLARNQSLLLELRGLIRKEILTGPNSQAELFTRQLEATYKAAWDRKFPSQTIDQFVSWTAPTETILTQDLAIDLLARRNDLFRFVAKDTGRWFEDECDFIVRHAANFGTLLDISSDPGLVVLPIGAALVDKGQLFCLRNIHHGQQLLLSNILRNHLENHVTVIGSLTHLSPPVLVRIAAECNDNQASIARELFENHQLTPPLFLVSLDSPNGPELATANYLDKCGYRSFFYHAGCRALVTYRSDTQRDSFSRNLFYVLPEAIPLLKEHGIIAETEVTDIEPDSTSDLWRGIARLPGSVVSATFDPAYIAALNAYSLSQDDTRNADERLRLFRFAELVLAQLVLTQPTVPRMYALIRLAREAGNRDEAIRISRNLIEALANKHGAVLSEPYLLPIDEVGKLPEINDDEAAWCHSLALITLEYLRSWSPFFTAAESTTLWKELANLPWCREMAEHKLALLSTLWEQTG